MEYSPDDLKHIISSLEKNIKAWEDIIAGHKGDHGAAHDPLCIKYRDGKQGIYCGGCPVMVETGKPFCHGTPYERWYQHQSVTHKKVAVLFKTEKCIVCDGLAQQQLDYYKGLLTKFKTKLERMEYAEC